MYTSHIAPKKHILHASETVLVRGEVFSETSWKACLAVGPNASLYLGRFWMPDYSRKLIMKSWK